MSTLNESTDKLREFHTGLKKWLDENKGAPPETIIRMWIACQEAYEAHDEERKALYATLEGISRNFIPEAMQERMIKTLSLDDIKRRVTVNVRVSCSIVPDRKDLAFQWLRENGAEALIAPTVNASALSSFAKSQLTEFGRDLPVDLFKTSSLQYTSATKIK